MCSLVANLCLLLYHQWKQKHAPASMRNQSLAAPAVSSQYGLVSNELSAEGLLRQSLNSRGSALVLRAATPLQTPVPAHVCAHHMFLGSYTQDALSTTHHHLGRTTSGYASSAKRGIIVAGHSANAHGPKRKRLQITSARGNSGGDNGSDGGASTTGTLDPAAAAPAVSSQYDPASNELSAEGLLQHPFNSRGLAPVLRAATFLQTPVPARVCGRYMLFGNCTTTGCSFDHSATPWPDDKRLRILRKARDIIVAGHSKIHTRLLPLHNYLLLFLLLIPKDFDVALLPATLILLHYFFCGSRSTLLHP